MFNSFPRPIPDSGGTAIKGIVKEYQVYAGDTISAGGFVEFTLGKKTIFEEAQVSYVSVAGINETTAIVAYCDIDNSNYGTAAIVTISNGLVEIGSPYVFESATTYYANILKLTETKAIVIYEDVGNSGYGTARVLSIAGTTITAPTSSFVFADSKTNYIASRAISETSVLVSYQDNGNSSYGTAIILSISGTSISSGSPNVYNSGATVHQDLTLLSSTKAVVAYRDTPASGDGNATVLTISGTTISHGSEYRFNADTTAPISIETIDSNSAIVVYVRSITPMSVCANVLSVSGTTITVSSPKTIIESSGASNVYVIKNYDNNFIIFFNSNVNNSEFYVGSIETDSTNINILKEFSLKKGGGQYLSASKMSDQKIIIGLIDYTVYKDQGIVIPISIDSNGYIVQATSATSYTKINGIAKSKGTSGNNIKVYTTEDAP